MRVKVKLYAELKQYGLDETDEFDLDIDTIKHQNINPVAGISINNLIQFLGIPDYLRFRVLINGRHPHSSSRIKYRDTVIIFPVIDGG